MTFSIDASIIKIRECTKGHIEINYTVVKTETAKPKIDGQEGENGIVLDCGEDNESEQDEEEPHLIEVSDWTTYHRKLLSKLFNGMRILLRLKPVISSLLWRNFRDESNQDFYFRIINQKCHFKQDL